MLCASRCVTTDTLTSANSSSCVDLWLRQHRVGKQLTYISLCVTSVIIALRTCVFVVCIFRGVRKSAANGEIGYKYIRPVLNVLQDRMREYLDHSSYVIALIGPLSQ